MTPTPTQLAQYRAHQAVRSRLDERYRPTPRVVTPLPVTSVERIKQPEPPKTPSIKAPKTEPIEIPAFLRTRAPNPRDEEGFERHERPYPRIALIQFIVARFYRISRTDMLAQRRTAEMVRPRQIAMFIAKTATLKSLPEIGRMFGRRDHTTVLHAVRKVADLMRTDPKLADQITQLVSLIIGAMENEPKAAHLQERFQQRAERVTG